MIAEADTTMLKRELEKLKKTWEGGWYLLGRQLQTALIKAMIFDVLYARLSFEDAPDRARDLVLAGAELLAERER